MTIAMQPIYTQTVGSGGAASIVFNNIPQTFTDLKVVLSVRPARAGNTWDSIGFLFNGDTSAVYSTTLLYGGFGTVASIRNNNAVGLTLINYASSSTATANTFGNGEMYIPNYTGANFKSVIGDSVAENNGSDYILGLSAGLYRSTSAVTSMSVAAVSGGTFAQYSTISIYGITKG